MFGWLKPKKEKNRVIVELSNDNGATYIIDVPRGRTPNKVYEILEDSGFEPDFLTHDSTLRPGRKRKIFESRDHEEYRFDGAESIDRYEDLEDNGDFEPDAIEVDNVDDEESDQTALRFWKNW